jgi:sec-independent protein translocase protein TatC
MRPLRESARAEALREMSFWDHLGELRGVLVSSLIALLGLSIVAWFFSGTIMDWLVADVPVDHLMFVAPSEAFMTRMKLSFILGGLAGFPYVGYRVWRFVSPGLFRRERKGIFPVVAASAVLFYAGVAFGYFIVVPVIVRFMLGFATDRIQPVISVGCVLRHDLAAVPGVRTRIPAADRDPAARVDSASSLRGSFSGSGGTP